MKNKRAQIQMMETMAVLLIFFVLIVLGFSFYMRVVSFGQSEKTSKDQELVSIRVSQLISFLPELQCSSKNIVKDNCFDRYKLDAFDLLADEKIYFPFFYYSTILVDEIYPSDTKKWVIYNYTGNYSSAYRSISPVLLYDPVSRSNSFGILNVTYYTVG